MKTKKIKTLTLNKETIAHLKYETMNVVKGGTSKDLCSEVPMCQYPITKYCTRYCTVDDC